MTHEPKAKKPRPPVTPWSNATDSQRAEIERIAALQKKLALEKDTDFCRDCDVHAATWGQLKRGVYPGNIAALVKRMTAFARVVEELHAQKAADRGLRLHDKTGFVMTDAYRKLRTAATEITSAADFGSENKCVWVVGRTGKGKDATLNQLMTEGFTTWKIHARPSWKHRYMPALESIRRGIGAPETGRGIGGAERDIIDYLNHGHKGLLLFTEVELVCIDVLNFLRTILNETDAGVVIFITPEYYDRLLHRGMRRGDTGTVQLFRRSELVIHLEDISDEFVEKIFARRWELTPELRTAAAEVATEANVFGAADFVQRVVRAVAKSLDGTNARPTLHLIRKWVAACRSFVPVATLRGERRAA